MEAEKPFGLRVYEQLIERGHLDLLTKRLDWSGIQKFKQAERDAVIRTFSGCPWAFLQKLKQARPEDMVDMIIQMAREEEAARLRIQMFFVVSIVITNLFRIM